MKITYWSGFSKRKNSTKQPTSGTEVDVVLKDNCSILNPIFDTTTVPDTVTYIYVSDFGRYYFVSDVVHITKDRIEIHCDVDVLATYKSSIGAYSGFVEFASSSTNLKIKDPRNVPTELVDASYDVIAFSPSHFDTTGCYIIGVLNDVASGATGVISYYAVNASEIVLFTSEIYSASFISQLQNQFNAVQDSLVSCVWVPIGYNTIPGGSQNIHIGRETAVATGKKLTNRILTNTTGAVTTTFPSGNSGGVDMEYIDCPPYTTGALYLPFVGLVPLNMEHLAFTKNISIDYTVDIITGDVVYQIKYGGLWSSTFNGNCATKMPVTGASYDGVGVATGALAVIGGAIGTALTVASEGGAAPVLGGVASMIGGAMSAAKSMELHTMINGSSSSAIGAHLGLSPYYVIFQYQPSMTDLESIKTEQGLPVYKVQSITSGFNKLSNASVDISGYDAEKTTVNGYLNSGFYYE